MPKEKLKHSLKESEERFFQIFDSNPVGMVITDFETNKFQYVNKMFLVNFGFTKKDVIGKTSIELNLIDPSFREKILLELKEQGYVKSFENLTRKKNGDPFWNLTSIQVVTFNSKKFALASFYDIDERKKTEEKVRLYSEIVKHIPIGISINHFENIEDTRTLKIIDVNPAFEKITGLNRGIAVGRYLADVSPEAFVKGRDKVYQEIVRSGNSKDLGLVYHPGDGLISDKYYFFLAFPMPGNYLIISIENVVERVKAEKILDSGLGISTDHDIYVKVNSMLVKINTKDIVFIEANGDYIDIHTTTSKFTVHALMKEIEAKLPVDFFMRVHHSYIVRLDKILKIDENIILVQDKHVPVSRANKQDLMNRLKVI